MQVALRKLETANVGAAKNLPSLQTVASRNLVASAVRDGIVGQPTQVARKLLQSISANATSLHWWQNQNYLTTMPKTFLDNYSSCYLVGPPGSNSPFHATDIKVGLFLLGPGINYPAHNHPASEIYFVLSGSSIWQKGKQTERLEAPGNYIFHASNQPHAMRTLTKPLLALWAWIGDDLKTASNWTLLPATVRARARAPSDGFVRDCFLSAGTSAPLSPDQQKIQQSRL